MKISVIIPTYKPESYLYDCLRSLSKQTLSPQEWEVLLVLNGERDPYRSNIETYISEHMQGVDIHLLYSEIPSVSNARNLGLDQACGEYITFIDDDDYVSETYLEDLLSVSSPQCIGISYWYSFADVPNALFSPLSQLPYSLSREYDLHAPHGKQNALSVRRFFAGPCCKLIHRNMIATDRFDVRFSNMEDTLFLFTISWRFRQVDFAPRSAIYYRRMRSHSVAHGRSFLQRFSASAKAIKAYTCVYFSNPSKYNFCFYVTRILGAVKGAFYQDA